MDPLVGTGLVLLGSKELLLKLLGPSADYIGNVLAQWTEAAHKNLRRVFENAFEKLGDRVESEGQVPPRVLKAVLEEGAFAEDPLMADYLGGVLASSRSGTPRDDRGAAMVALIARLSTYQLRTHYIFYTVAHDLLAGMEVNLGMQSERQAPRARLFVPFSAYMPAMEFVDGEDPNIFISHALYGLIREELLDDWFVYGGVEHLSKEAGTAIPEDGFLLQLAPLGVELYLAARGLPDLTLADFLNPEHAFAEESLVPIRRGSSTLGELMKRAEGSDSTTPG